MIHIRFEGRSFDVAENDIGVNAAHGNDEIMQRVASFLETPAKRLENYVIDRRPSGEIVIRPEAVYG
jgi:hypothetical protein